MKTILTLTLTLLFLQSNAQTNILDSYVDWAKGNLTVYLSDSLASSVSVKLGTSLQASDVFDDLFNVGTDLPLSSTLNILLANVSQGIYYVTVTITRPDTSTQEMEFQTLN